MKVRAKIKSLGYGGSFVGEIIAAGDHSETRAGKKVFVREAAPGEIVDVEVTKEEPKFVLGALAGIVEPSPERTTPPCPKFGVCGGCDLQQLNLAAQRRAKVDMVATMLSVQGKLPPRSGVEILGADLPGLHYRRRIQLHLDRRGQIGFYRAGSSTVVDIDRCYLADERLNVQLSKLRSVTPALAPVVGGVILEQHGEETITVLTTRDDFDPRRNRGAVAAIVGAAAPVCGDLIVRRRSEDLYRQRGGVEVVGADEADAVGHFSQVNEAANEILVGAVGRFVESARVTDLYAGAGNFAVPLARAGREVTAVELDPALVVCGTRRARSEGLTVTYVPLPCEKFVERHPLAETVVLDPPRAGAREVVERIDSRVTRRVVYVSCHLPSLTRDLKILVERGFTFEKLFVVDMFPQTHHVETVAILSA